MKKGHVRIWLMQHNPLVRLAYWWFMRTPSYCERKLVVVTDEVEVR